MSTDVPGRVRLVLEEDGLLDRGLLVAVSGGLDSVCLLRLLAGVVGPEGGRLEVAHVDHGLREASAEDARFCSALAEELGLPFHLRRLAPEEFRRGLGVQAEARRLRREFFEEVLVARGLDAVALGHHADDQAETVLLRLIRGTGPRGVAAMSPWVPPYLRPLLGTRRAEIEALASRQGWPFREDASNQNPRYLRNRIRHEVLPLLRTLNPNVEAAVTQFARLAAEDDAELTAAAQAELAVLMTPEPEGFRMPIDRLKTLSAAIRRRLYLSAWQSAGGDPGALEARHLRAVDDLLDEGKPQRRAPVPGPAVFSRCWGDLWVLRCDALVGCPGQVVLGGPGRIGLGAFGVEVIWGEAAGESARAVLLPEGRPRGELLLRPWKPGDRLGERKVKDLLMDARLPSWRRSRSLVAEDGAGILGLLAPGGAWSLPDAALRPPNQGIWLEERGEKRWCP